MALSPAQPLLSLKGSDVEEDTTMTAPEDVLDTPEGELALLTALIQFRPVGLSRHWAMMAILKSVQARLHCNVTSDSIWRKLEALYDLSLLEEDSDMAGPPIPAEKAAKIAATTAPTGPLSPPPSNDGTRKRKRRSSVYNAAAIAAQASTSEEKDKPEPYDALLFPIYPPSTSVTSVYSNIEFSLLDKAQFQDELGKRRMATTPSPGPATAAADDGSDLSSPKHDDNDDTEMVDETLTPSKVAANSEQNAQTADVEPSKGHRRRKSQRSPTRASAAPANNRRGGRKAKDAKDEAVTAEDGDNVSETASTLSALSENGEDDGQKTEEDESLPTTKKRGSRSARTKRKEPSPPPAETVESDDEPEGVNEEGSEGAAETEESGGGLEDEAEGESLDEPDDEDEDEDEDSPDEIGPGDMPFKSPGKSSKKAARQSKLETEEAKVDEQPDQNAKAQSKRATKGLGGNPSRPRGKGSRGSGRSRK